MLSPNLAPLLAYRLTGPELCEGRIPASVVVRAVTRPTAAVKRLLEALSNTVAQGRPENSFRNLYDLPTQRFAFNSFEVTFAIPPDADFEFGAVGEPGASVYRQGAERLDEAIAWLKGGDNKSADPDLALLEVLDDLVPPAHGDVLTAELRGRLVPNHQVVELTRGDRKKVKQAISRTKKRRELVLTVGLVREFDKDKFTFILRARIANEPDLSCAFGEEFYDDLYDAFDTDQKVQIQGRMSATGKVLEVVAVEPWTLT